MKPFDKPSLTIEQQLVLLKERGLIIRDDERACRFLEVVSLFRLTPYMRPFQHAGNPHHQFRENTKLRQIVTIYRFDRELRNLVMDAMERIEVAVRAGITNHMSPAYGDSHWYLDRQNFKCNYNHARLIKELNEKMAGEKHQFQNESDRIDASNASDKVKRQRIEQRKRDNYFRFYGEEYNEPPLPPSWAALEELSLGALSRLYKGIAKDSDRKKISLRFNLPQEVLGSWLHSFTFIRNCCAHHSRLWNRELAIPPKLPNRSDWAWPQIAGQPRPERRLFVISLMLAYLMRHVSPDSAWKQRFEDLLTQYPDVPLASMGFVERWNEHPIWVNH